VPENTFGLNTEPSAGAGAGLTVRALLCEYCDAAGEDAASQALDRLFADHAQPWCTEITRGVLRKYALRNADLDDQVAETEAEVLLKVTTRLRSMREGSAVAISDLRAYIASCVYNVCFMRLRNGSPERARLENRLRYLLRHDARYGLWEAGGETVTGIARWKGRVAQGNASAPQYPAREPGALMEQIFKASGGPVPFSSLVSAAAEALGVADFQPVEFLDSMHRPGHQADAEDVLGHVQRLALIWPEVLALPANQRAALLLNLRDEEGQGAIELVIATGVASFSELARALGVSVQKLEEMWDELPLEDSRIAEMLGLSRQQVINLRKSARGRLGRREARSENMEADSASTPDVGRSSVGKAVRRFFGAASR
jgi:hypothetical protein